MKKIKIGMVCPYGWDSPGGVQTHIRELTKHLQDEGHQVSVFAPVSDENRINENWLVNAGKPISIPVNGSVARLLFGPIASSRVKQWITQGDFDLLHLHEPAIPSLSLLACSAATGPMVGTFHVSSPKQKAIYAIGPILEPIVEKLTARIAVSESARQTLMDHFDTDAVVIPNGIESSQYALAQPTIHWRNPHTLGFIGRFEESRKGLQILLDALPIIARFIPDVRLLVAGPGDGNELIKKLDVGLRNRIVFLGFLSEQEKASFLKSINIYVAPNTGGESFGIILTEALSAGTPVVGSDIPAFKAVLENGDAGLLFKNEDSEDLAKVLIRLLRDDELQQKLSSRGKLSSQKYDWQVVADQILSVYEMAMAGGKKVGLTSDSRFWNRR